MAWHKTTYVDDGCIPKRYSPCPQQLLDQQIGAGRPGISPNGVVVLVFFITVLIWAGSFVGFWWWMKRDVRIIREAMEEARSAKSEGRPLDPKK